MIRTLNPEEAAVPANPAMLELQSLCKNLRAAHDAALTVCDDYEAQKLALEKKFSPALVKSAEAIKMRNLTLHLALEDSAALFTEPKTQTFFGIRVGWMKAKGTISFTDEATVIARAEDLLTKPQAAGVIKTTKKLVKKALSELSADVLRKLGVTLTADTDVPFIKPVEGDAVKKLNALLKGSEEEKE